MKKIASFALACMMVLMVMAVPSYDVYAANLSLSVSSSSVKIGDTVKATVSVPSGITATVDVYFPTNLFEFVSATGTTNVNGGTVATTLGDPFSSSITVTLKAKTSGTATISAASIKAGDNNNVDADGNPASVSLGGASASVSIANQTVTQPETPGNSETQGPGNNESNGGGTAETPKSGDNSLSSLKLSAGTLSPSFKYNVTKYTASVDYDVTKVVVSAKASNAKATIESVTGNGNVSLKVGENTIQIVVKAENGVKATYTIVVTRKAQETVPSENPDEPQDEPQDNPQNSENSESSENSEQPQETETQPQETESQQEQGFEYNGQKLNIIEEIPSDAVPADFKAETITIDGKETAGVRFSKGNLTALYLANEAGYGSFYIYDEKEQSIYPFIKLTSEKNYVIVLRPDDASAPSGFLPCTLSIEGKGTVLAYRYAEAETEETSGLFEAETYYAAEPKISDFYLIYCMNGNGEYGWYQYDSVEGTFQRYIGTVTPADVPALGQAQGDTAEIKALKNRQKIMLGISVIVILALVAAVISLVVSKRRLAMELEEGYDYEESDMEPVEEELNVAEEHDMSVAGTQMVSSFEEMIESYERTEESAEEAEQSTVSYEAAEETAESDFAKAAEPGIEEDEIELEMIDISLVQAEKAAEEAEADEDVEIEFFEIPGETFEKTVTQPADEKKTESDTEQSDRKEPAGSIEEGLAAAAAEGEKTSQNDSDDDLEFIDL
uniref:cadherin-like beta sandwich domain-containing protein n=1 Tax=Agathobacter sp. TaxID=2021311 RepID=UPI004055B9FE